MRHHCIISGTGRAGTTALVRLLTRLGLETGFDPDKMQVDENANAGLERQLFEDDAPYIVKSPWICTYIHEIVDRADLIIDSAIVPMREIGLAAESRRRVHGKHRIMDAVIGGLWNVERPEDQERELGQQFFNLIFHLSRKDVPIVFLQFPRLVDDADYLYEKLSRVLSLPGRETFREAFLMEMKPELVHLRK
jgi:hypothetical protein